MHVIATCTTFIGVHSLRDAGPFTFISEDDVLLVQVVTILNGVIVDYVLRVGMNALVRHHPTPMCVSVLS